MAQDRKDTLTMNKNAVRQKLYFGLFGYQNSGWGVCRRYLMKELTGIIDLHVLQNEADADCNVGLDGMLFQGLKDADFMPFFTRIRGTRNIGYTFFEKELTQASIENARRFDLVLAGSTWCRERMQEKGIANCDVLLQGIDPDIFHPISDVKTDDRFVIFSGGKFELRKSQDLVLRAIKIMQDRHPDVWLINSWYNLWEGSIRMMEASRHITFKHTPGQSWQATMLRTYQQNGLDPGRIITCDLVPYEKQRQLFAQTDLGVFPNRCEGGTNLVMMEYMACGKPVVASFTSGHKDIMTPENALWLKELHDLKIVDHAGEAICRWQEPSLEELLAQLEYAYQNRSAIAEIGRKAGESLGHLTWKKSAQRLVQFINTLGQGFALRRGVAS
jgi:glycosyltransferase involved in cell wall biosynthesis